MRGNHNAAATYLHLVLSGALTLVGSAGLAHAQTVSYARDVQPLLQKYCYDCHGEGSSRGDVELDKHASDQARLADKKLWASVTEIVRADMMPPAGKPRPTPAERAKLIQWIRGDVHQVDCRVPDPGRVTMRRLNRTEYNYTVRDLFGLKFDPGEYFPPDDSGYGFDNNADVLTMSPVLMDKYLDAAERVVKAVVAEKPSIPEHVRLRGDFRVVDEPAKGHSIREARFHVERAGVHDLKAKINVFSFVPFKGEARVQLFVDDKKLMQKTYVSKNADHNYRFRVRLEPGEHVWRYRLDLSGAQVVAQRPINVTLEETVVRGPMGVKDYPEAHKRLFFDGKPSKVPAERVKYAREILRRVADHAFRRPVDEPTLERLVGMVNAVDKGRPGEFERGVAQALQAILVTPRFLFRDESPRPLAAVQGPRGTTMLTSSTAPAASAATTAHARSVGRTTPIDDWALASRLSYLLWAAAPDERLREVAASGKLRTELRSEVRRLILDPKANRFVTNFVGQWLQARDVESVPIHRTKIRVYEPLRKHMRAETDEFFAYIMREDRPLLELITANYTFVNEPLAKVYDMPDIVGERMRKVSLPPDSPRGGILGQSTFLVVTSNPSRTSPVKRGLFVLENLLGTPPPPPPPDIPDLPPAEKGKPELTMREQMEIHRANPACKNCHARMDPIGLGLEGFDHLGMAREQNPSKPIDTGGTLITGEKFSGARELRTALAGRKDSFYRTVTRKLLTYALGRGLSPADDCTVDGIVTRLQKDGGRFSALLHGIIESVPFQNQLQTKEIGS